MNKLKFSFLTCLLIIFFHFVISQEQKTNSTKRKSYSPSTKIFKKENPRKLYLFCKNCTLDRRLWKKLEQIFGSYLNETPYEIRPSIILSKNYSLAENVFGITEFPAFVFVDRNETSTFDASMNPMNLTYLNYWLSSTNVDDKIEFEIYPNLKPKFRSNFVEITTITHINFDEKVLDSTKFWLILLKNPKRDDRSCKIYDGEHLIMIQNKIFNENSLKIHLGLLETIDYNYVFVRKRFEIDTNLANCPIYVKILNNKFQSKKRKLV